MIYKKQQVFVMLLWQMRSNTMHARTHKSALTYSVYAERKWCTLACVGFVVVITEFLLLFFRIACEENLLHMFKM